MQRHFGRVVRYGWLPTVTLVAVLVSDMPSAIKNADRNIHDILANLGVDDPPFHAASYVWQHPWSFILLWFLIFIVGALISCAGEWLWRKFRHSDEEGAATPPVSVQAPLLYLSNTIFTDFPNDPDYKVIGVEWNPEDFDLDFRGDLPHATWPPLETKENTLSFNMLNSGPEDARHIEATWELPIDLTALLGASNIFGECLDSVEPNIVRLFSEKQARNIVVMPVVTAPPIPLVSVGQNMVLRAPEHFTNALMIAALVRAKQHVDAYIMPADLGLRVMSKHMEQSQTRMDEMRLRLSYVRGDRSCVQSFRIGGWVWRAQEPISRKPKEGTTYDHVKGGVAATIHSLWIQPDD